MKTKKVSLFIICLMILLNVISCKKYEDGPSFSLRTKKARLCGDWTFVSATLNGNDITATLSNLFEFRDGIKINTDKTFSTKGNFTDKGKWEFEDRKVNIHLVSDGSGLEHTYKILKLEDKNLWWKFTAADGNVYVWKFKQ